MSNFSSGIFDRTRLASNILMLILVATNIFFSIQYTQNVKDQVSEVKDISSTRFLAIHALNDFIDIVLSTKGIVAYDDRVKLENDVLQIHDPALSAEWQAFVASKDTVIAQQQAVKIMSILVKKSV